MTMNKLFLVAMTICLLTQAASAQTHNQNSDSTPYAGFEDREIKSLSDADIDELRRGGGWGLALPAELNGKPGPAHLLELKNDLGLSDDQIAQITVIVDEMRREAIDAGERLIEAEAALSDAFAADSLDEEELRDLVGNAEAIRAELRYIHLSRHLATTPILTGHQVQKYQVLRGYATNPCDSVPEGHDPEMWKKHNGCT
mgnify:CR=1 FL=1